MFFGLEVKSNQAQAKPVSLENTLKLSQAVLDPSKNGKKEPVSVMVEYEKKQFILCVLDPNIAWQSPLDLVFEGGSSVKFFIKGTGTVHLTGYQTDDDLDDMSMSMSDFDEDISDNEEILSADASGDEKVAKKVPTKNAASKVNGNRVPVKAKEETKQQQARRVKGAPAKAQPDDEDLDSDSDDEDYDALNQVDDEDSDDDEDDDESDDDDDIDMDEEEVDLDEEASDDE